MAGHNAVVTWFDGGKRMFLTVSGGLSPEYPEARIFTSTAVAARFADKLRDKFPATQQIDVVVNLGLENEGSVYAI